MSVLLIVEVCILVSATTLHIARSSGDVAFCWSQARDVLYTDLMSPMYPDDNTTQPDA